MTFDRVVDNRTFDLAGLPVSRQLQGCVSALVYEKVLKYRKMLGDIPLPGVPTAPPPPPADATAKPDAASTTAASTAVASTTADAGCGEGSGSGSGAGTAAVSSTGANNDLGATPAPAAASRNDPASDTSASKAASSGTLVNLVCICDLCLSWMLP